MYDSLAHVNKLLLPFLPDSRFLHCRNTEFWCRECGWGLVPLLCQVKENPRLLGGKDREECKGMYGLVRLLPNAEYRDHGSKLFTERVGMDLAAVIPLALAALFPWK